MVLKIFTHATFLYPHFIILLSALSHSLWLVKFWVIWVWTPFYWTQYFKSWEYSSIHSLSYYITRQSRCVLPFTTPNPKPLSPSYPQSPPPSSNMVVQCLKIIQKFLWHSISGFGFTVVLGKKMPWLSQGLQRENEGLLRDKGTILSMHIMRLTLSSVVKLMKVQTLLKFTNSCYSTVVGWHNIYCFEIKLIPQQAHLLPYVWDNFMTWNQ